MSLLRVSVRELAAFALRAGDLMPAALGHAVTAMEGIRGHQLLQKSRPDHYRAEVRVRQDVAVAGVRLEIAGRIDGVFDESPPVIEEIKTTRRDFEQRMVAGAHLDWGQAKLYAHLYAMTCDVRELAVQLTYFRVDKGTTRSERRSFSRSELADFFQGVVAKYATWAQQVLAWREQRNASSLTASFPFEQFRKGQRRFAAEVYRAIRGQSRVFLQAPTGIGKTLGALFPAGKALAAGEGQTLFFLTAKTTGAQIAVQALARMAQAGMPLKAVQLTARDKMCREPACDPRTCPLAQGYYDRLHDAMAVFFEEDLFDRDRLRTVAETHGVCPFEFSLDLAAWADVVIGDYNYAFDPGVQLRRFFGETKNAVVLLVDEAHNLVDRGRSMFSARLNKADFLALKRSLPAGESQLKARCQKVSSALARVRKAHVHTGEPWLSESVDEDVLAALRSWLVLVEADFADPEPSNPSDAMVQLYFDVRAFLRTASVLDERFRVIWHPRGRRDLGVHLYCMDPSAQLRAVHRRCEALVCFSATLSPPHYFRHLLGGEADDLWLRLPSPFAQSALAPIVVNRVSTRYRDRDRSADQVAQMIKTTIHAKSGHYLVFFPSYAYLDRVLDRLDLHNVPHLVQEPQMDDEARAAFIERFNDTQQGQLVGFAVMGGVFAEGIDLVGERLVGVVIVGVGLPKICLERRLIARHFAELGEDGFAFAYQYPGMNRVLQAAGRVIRAESDRGVVVLIDDRFDSRVYHPLFPPMWRPRFVGDSKGLAQVLGEFWLAQNDQG